MSVDRDARRKLAEELRHYVAKQSSNFELNDAIFDIRTSDRVMIAVRDTTWMLYDDLRKHKAEGKWAIEDAARREVARWILFLHSDLEYEWRGQKPWYLRIPVLLLSIFTFSLIWKPIRAWIDRQGDPEVWPFIRQPDFIAANGKAY